MIERAKVPSCVECTAHEENPREFVENEICPACPWSQSIFNPRLDRVLHVLALLDAGCPVGRHELCNNDWVALGAVKRERDRLAAEKGTG